MAPPLPALLPALLRAFYLAASLLILVIQAVPALRTRFLAYGPRATTPPAQHKQEHRQHRQPSALSRALDYAASLQVPHGFFSHFYVTSVACSLLWAWQMHVWHAHRQQQVVWALLLLQGLRRVLESHVYTSASKSTMSVAHWLLGLLFYVTINAAIWAETPGTASANALLVPAVMTAQMLQHSYHAYLYRLRTESKGYQLPSHPMFPNLLCPHYTCEVVVYALLSLIAAPDGSLVNWTLVCGAIFVATNLGVTAVGTKEWYMAKFGADKVGSRKRMVPAMW
ncbi:hypothetical protein COCC4DRAFT_187106 [Bipolaris maydis ATCC 48331]|nr:uncharacterized protein COCC4DRAFT_187106 [Bipolaris maydis ATCC 48331]ENI09395.1 hypothetical protein COCC4DRAFT_187106 [Bipolaris maydis ATCC 48331]KAJ5058282.1 hypothetical protein J3E74DRAFT_275246 [Bipolaris maydis]KAJ6195528.1 hypothetical protein J3E72DRAFT_440754 [Bipolaris maydis]KAJ6206306.1 hypothetical protein PSV09DRAFT_2392497 [Bipolaris maydis]